MILANGDRPRSHCGAPRAIASAPMGRDCDREAREVVLRAVRWSDALWLIAAGLSPELAGRQYGWSEAPLQLVIAPLRAALGPAGPAAVVEVVGRRAGYIGRNPLSGNLEYFLAPWARGGVGRPMIRAFLIAHRPGDRPRCFFVSRHNTRSLATLLGALDDIGWIRDVDYWVDEVRFGRQVWVGVGHAPTATAT